ncbi:MAG: hypothetical protein ABIQ27_03405 [Flavobacterium sp.]|uniref:hypothetical protein n=1 Tax=Flavobacterium sp. TaxID=239 RepID=UPI0032638C5D
MKTIITILILISSLTSFSQSDKIAGDYQGTLYTKEGDLFEYKFTLSQDGTFVFHYYSNMKLRIPRIVNKYGKGNWKWVEKDKMISFVSDKQKDFDEKNTLDFTNSKARFITKSPRDKSDEIVKTRFIFFQSEISWIKGIGMFKI